jgi:hypothetical protein
MATKNKLDKLLVKSVDGALKDIFGEAGARVIYDYLRDKYSLRLEEVPDRLEDFERGLERILSSGAGVTERVALKKLYSRFGLEYRNKANYGFVDHVVELKTQL